MLPLLVLLFIAVPIAELAVIIQVGQEIGILPTLAILIVDSVFGSLLLRSQGRAAWRRFTTTLQSGRPPAREVLDGALVLVGGVLLLTPGFITDILGFSLLLPPTRAVFRRLLSRRLMHRMVVGMTGAGRPGVRRPGGPPPGGGPGDIEGTAVEADRPGRLPG